CLPLCSRTSVKTFSHSAQTAQPSPKIQPKPGRQRPTKPPPLKKQEATVNPKLKIKKAAAIVICLAALTAALSRPSSVKAAVTDQDRQFLATAAQSDFDEIKLSQLAEGKATNPLVKSFAHEMVTDHTNLEAKMKPF